MATFSKLLVVLLLSISVIGKGQDKTNSYRPLSSAGEIPVEFRSLTASKVQQAQAKDKSVVRNYKERNQINEFLLKSNYVIDNLLTSGKILFGDSVTQYINEVADVLLKNDPALRNNLRFYVVKSNEVNAFATAQGIIFVTMGLIAQIENEAQLAFVLAHEIAHFTKEHAISSVLESSRIYDQTRKDRYNGYQSRIKLLSTFSKDKEFESDSIGFLRFTSMNFDKQAASSMMDVLQLSFLPYEEIKFDPSFLEMDSMRFPVSLLPDSLNEIPLDTDEFDDSKSSHPNIAARRAILERMIDQQAQTGGRKFILPKEKFARIHRIARYETIHLHLIEQEYIGALFNAYVMVQKYPDDPFLEESIASLYSISKYVNKRRWSFQDALEDTYGEMYACSYFFDQLSAEQINFIAIRYLIKISNKYHNPFIEMLLDDLIAEGMKSNELSWEYLQTGISNCRKHLSEKSKSDTIDTLFQSQVSIATDSTEVNSVDSKYEKLRKSRKEKAKGDVVISADEEHDSWSEVFHFMSFSSSMTEEFKDRIFQIGEKQKEETLADEAWEQELKTKKKYYTNYGYSLGIDSIVFVDPFFFLTDERKGYQIIDSEMELLDFKNQLKLCAQRSGLEHEIIFPKTMSETDIDQYNHMATMNDWVGEKLAHEGVDVNMIPLQTEYTASLAEHYGTNFFCYTGVFSTTEKRYIFPATWVYSVIFFPLLPVTIVRALSPVKSTNFYFLLYNVRTGETKWTTEKSYNKSAANGYVNSLMYDILYQVKKTEQK